MMVMAHTQEVLRSAKVLLFPLDSTKSQFFSNYFKDVETSSKKKKEKRQEEIQALSRLRSTTKNQIRIHLIYCEFSSRNVFRSGTDFFSFL